MAKKGSAVVVDGLADLRRDLRRMDPALARGVRRAIKDATEIVARDARTRAPRSSSPRGPHMADTIRAEVKFNVGMVRVRARRVSPGFPQGYDYPRRIEYEGSGGNRAGLGPRAFLGPALEANRDEVERRIGRVLDDVADIWED